jgi:hypothetical protein
MVKKGRPKMFKSAKDIDDKVTVYKAYLKDNEKLPTMAGLAYHLGCDRKTLYNYSKDDAFFPTIKKYRDWIEMNLEEIAIDKGNGGIVFLMKNYGYTDKQYIESKVEVNSPINDLIDSIDKLKNDSD